MSDALTSGTSPLSPVSPDSGASARGTQWGRLPIETVDKVADLVTLADKVAWYHVTGHLGDAAALGRELSRIQRQLDAVDRVAQQRRLARQREREQRRLERERFWRLGPCEEELYQLFGYDSDA